MSLYNDLATVLTPYANKINLNESDIGDIQDELSTINESLDNVQADLDDNVNAIEQKFENIGYVKEVCANLLNPAELEPGRITSTSSVLLHTGSYDTDYRTTGFMPVESGKKYGFYYKKSGNIVNLNVANIWAYDINKDGLSYVGSIASNPDGTTYITAPNNAKYIRASIVTAAVTTYGLLQFSETDGTAPLDIVGYSVNEYLAGYVQSTDFDALSDEVALVKESLIDVYGDMTGELQSSKYIKANGSIADISAENYKVLVAQVGQGKRYKITADAYSNSYYYGFYDSNNVFIDGVKATQSGTTFIYDVIVTAPQNAVTLAVASSTGIQRVKNVVRKTVTHDMPWVGKKWACVGDSLTENNVATTKHYFDYIADLSGVAIYNMGAGGTGYSRGYDSNRAFYQRILSVPTDADVVTIFGSGNDTNTEAMAKFDGKTWQQALGSYTDNTTDTLCGCVNVTLDNYFSVMPTVPIGIIAPSPWRTQPTTLLNHNRFADYTNALKQIADYRGVSFLDLYHYSNLRPENDENCDLCFYSGASLDGNGDGVHPNELGHKIIAPKIYEFVKSLLLD